MRNLTKRFDAVLALDHANFKINSGEIMALLGSNGSGKSTLMKVLSGLVNPTEGEIFVDGKKVEINSSADSRKLGITVAYQDLSLIPNMSVADNILLGNEPINKNKTINKKKSREIVKTYLDMLKIDIDQDVLVNTLPSSTQSLIEIAKSLALKPKILILDEATASLHSDEVDVLFDLLLKLKSEGMAIVIVTHRMNEIFRICDKCTILKAGKTVMESDIKNIDLDQIVFHMTGKKPSKEDNTSLKEEVSHSDKDLVLDVHDLYIPRRVNGVSFKAYKGEIIGIGGLDGQGQSNFIRAVLADEKYSSGEIVYKGNKVNYSGIASAIHDNMGFISGDRNRESIFPIRSVAENIFAGKATKIPLFRYLSAKQVSQFAQDVIDEYGIVAGGLNDPASTLSGGNQQKLVVGRWIALSPDLLILDDPTKGVDIHSRQEIHKILKACNEKGMTVIYVSSDNEELLEISDRIYVFYEGKISAILSGDNRTEDKLVSAMLGLTNDTKKESVSANE